MKITTLLTNKVIEG